MLIVGLILWDWCCWWEGETCWLLGREEDRRLRWLDEVLTVWIVSGASCVGVLRLG